MRASVVAGRLAMIMMLLGAHAAYSASPSETVPSWAFAPSPPAQRAPSSDEPLQVPGSTQHFTTAQVRDGFAPPDWYPDSHPPMPPIVAVGRKPSIRACGFCHLPNGQGRPENAPLASLPASYIAEQIADFNSGQRTASGPIGPPLSAMIAIARNLAASDTAAAASYFSQLHYQPWIRVIETRQVPKTHPVGGMLQPIPGAGTEPIGERIIEVPVSVERTEVRDSRSGFIAYVPVGSVARGATLARTGGDGRTIRCAICHGADLRGLAGVPAIAGRSPSYLMRQLYDIKYTGRSGLWTPLMREPLARLSNADMLSIVAYVATLPP